jgi:hypothetical protein
LRADKKYAEYGKEGYMKLNDKDWGLLIAFMEKEIRRYSSNEIYQDEYFVAACDRLKVEDPCTLEDAIEIARKEIRNAYLYRERNPQVEGDVSLDIPIGKENGLTFQEVADIGGEGYVQISDWTFRLEDVLSKLHPKYSKTMELLLDGYKQWEVAKMLNVSPSTISERLKKIKRIANPIDDI